MKDKDKFSNDNQNLHPRNQETSALEERLKTLGSSKNNEKVEEK